MQFGAEEYSLRSRVGGGAGGLADVPPLLEGVAAGKAQPATVMNRRPTHSRLDAQDRDGLIATLRRRTAQQRHPVQRERFLEPLVNSTNDHRGFDSKEQRQAGIVFQMPLQLQRQMRPGAKEIVTGVLPQN